MLLPASYPGWSFNHTMAYSHVLKDMGARLVNDKVNYIFCDEGIVTKCKNKGPTGPLFHRSNFVAITSAGSGQHFAFSQNRRAD